MTESRYKRDIESGINRLVGPLIQVLCGLQEGSRNYRRAEEYILYSLQNHKFLNPLNFDVDQTYKSIIEKMQINSQTDKAAKLRSLYQRFLGLRLPNPKGVVDLNIQVLFLLLKLSTTPLESDYVVPKLPTMDNVVDLASDSDADRRGRNLPPEESVSDLSDQEDEESEDDELEEEKKPAEELKAAPEPKPEAKKEPDADAEYMK